MPMAKKAKNQKKPASKTTATKTRPKKATAKTSTAPKQLATQKGTSDDLIVVGTSNDIRIKRRADSCIPSEIKQCLLTGKLDTEVTIGTCYLLNEHHWRNNKWLARLEWWWGMNYDSLQLDTKSNKVYLCQDWLQSFKSGQWILLPPFDMLYKISSHYGRLSRLPKDANKPLLEDVYGGAETFEYRLVPLDSNLPFINTSRLSGRITRSKTLSGCQPGPSHHSYPFVTLPTIISRVKPHFVICDAAPKLARTGWSDMTPLVSSIFGVDRGSAMCMIDIVSDSYILWGSQRPPSQFASSPRTSLLTPVATMIPRNFVLCDGACFYSRYEWSVHRCSRCKDSPHRCRFRLVGSTDSDSCDEFLSHDGTDGGDDSPQYDVYRKELILHVKKWLAVCSHQAEKRRWFSSVSDDSQLGEYAEDYSPKKRRRTAY